MFNRDGAFRGERTVCRCAVPVLAPGVESTFVVTVPGASDVGRYRVSFQSNDRVVAHVDRREPRPDRTHAVTAMTSKRTSRPRRTIVAGAADRCRCGAQQDAAPRRGTTEPARSVSESGVELINVTATVTDQSGRFVAGLRKEDFVVYEDDQPVDITHFSAERVPVSLGIVLDTSGSMAGDKIREAQARARSVRCSTCSTSRTRFSSTASATSRRCCRAGRPTGS